MMRHVIIQSEIDVEAGTSGEAIDKAASERLAKEQATVPLFEPHEIYKQEGLTFDTCMTGEENLNDEL